MTARFYVECSFKHETVWPLHKTIVNLYLITPQAVTQYSKKENLNKTQPVSPTYKFNRKGAVKQAAMPIVRVVDYRVS